MYFIVDTHYSSSTSKVFQPLLLQAEFKDLKKASKSVKDAQTRFILNDRIREASMIVEGTGPGGDLRKFGKARLPFFLKLLIGAQTPVVSVVREKGIRMKEDYHRFR